MLLAFSVIAATQQNTLIDADLQESAETDAARPGAETKPLTNKQVISLARSGIADDTIISLIARFPSGFDTSPEALMELRDAGVSEEVIDSIKNHTAGRAQAKPEQIKTLTDLSANELARLKKVGTTVVPGRLTDTQPVIAGKNTTPVKNPVPGNWALGLVYPGAAIRYQSSPRTAWEVKAQSGSRVLVVGPRFYYQLGSNNGLSLFCGLEGDYIGFKGETSEGSGFAGGAFIGGDISLSGPLRLSMDFGPMYISLNDNEFSESVSGIGYIINMGIYWHFK